MVEQGARILYTLCLPELCDLGRVACLRGRVGSGRQGQEAGPLQGSGEMESVFCSLTRHVSPRVQAPPWLLALWSPFRVQVSLSGTEGKPLWGLLQLVTLSITQIFSLFIQF